MATLLYVHIGQTTFVKKDMRILASSHDLIEYQFDSRNDLSIIKTFLHQLIFLLGKARKIDLVVVQFVGYHSLLPGWWARLRGVPLLIIASGTESARYPSISYGNFAKPAYAWVTRMSFRMAHHIAPVHHSLAGSENHYYPHDGVKQGYGHLVPGLQVPSTEIPYGFDAKKWLYQPKKQVRSFLSVALIPNKVRYVLKGIDLIVKMGERFPDCNFYVVGMKYTPEVTVPPNVHLMAAVAHEELAQYFREKQFYFQLSISEGHPNALCEAMLCGAVPIVSAVTSMPEIVGESGFVLKQRDEDQLAELIEEALGSDTETLGKQARARILERYPLDLRRKKLLDLVEELLSKN